MVQKYWITRKETMKKFGETPEGNVLTYGRTSSGSDLFPFLPWLTRDLVARTTRNIPDAMTLATNGSVRRKDDTLMSFNFEIKSQQPEAGRKKYVVRLLKEAILAPSATMPTRSLISCGCPGYQLVLAKSGEDDVCKHCGAVLLCCLSAYRRSQGLQLREPGLGPAASASLGYTRQDPVLAIQAPEVGNKFWHREVMAPRARSPAKSRATAALSQRTDGPPKPVKASEDVLSPRFKVIDGPAHCSWQSVLALEDEQRSEPGLEPAARAVPSILEGYDERAEEAAELLVNGGKLLSVLSSKQAQKMAVFLLGKAKERAILTAFTFDLLVVCNALSEAAQRGVQVQLYVDKSHSMKGVTAAQMDRLELLRRTGVEVFLAQGIVAGGIQHSKSLLVDAHFLCGSTNWTSSSRSNHEFSVLIGLSEEGKISVMEKLGYVMQSAELLTTKTAQASQDWREARSNRVRGRSAEPDMHATARRFSLARARSREAALGI